MVKWVNQKFMNEYIDITNAKTQTYMWELHQTLCGKKIFHNYTSELEW